MKNAVVVPHGGIGLSNECRESVERYCKRFGLAPVFLPEAKVNADGVGKYKFGRFEKFQAGEVLADFDRMMLLDADTLITDLAPNVFDVVAPDKLGVVREDVLNITKTRRRHLRTAQLVMGELDWHEGYFNSGVIVASKMHRDLWKVDNQLRQTILHPKLGKHKEQKIVNWRARKLGFELQWMDPRWNYLRMYEKKLGEPRTNSFVIHYAGRANRKSKRVIDSRVLTARRFYNKRCQMRHSQIEWIIRQAGKRMGGKVLFFGSGYDSLMWSKICDVTFLENNNKWYRRLYDDPRNQGIQCYLVTFDTRVSNWQEDLAAKRLNTLPPEIANSKFDVIIIDGPNGNRQSAPGRVSPILHAKRLLRRRGAIFVDDMR